MSIFDFSHGPQPTLVSADDLTALTHMSTLTLFKSVVHKVEVIALEAGTTRLYAVRRWIVYDEAHKRPMAFPETDIEQQFSDDAAGAADFGKAVAARTEEEDRRLYE